MPPITNFLLHHVDALNAEVLGKDRLLLRLSRLTFLLCKMAFRLHLDSADTSNGCLNVIPKSHHLGILSQVELTEVINKQRPYECEVEAGDLVLMKPHTLHASSKSIKPSHRRVIHIEYSNYELPSNLQWA